MESIKDAKCTLLMAEKEHIGQAENEGRTYRSTGLDWASMDLSS